MKTRVLTRAIFFVWIIATYCSVSYGITPAYPGHMPEPQETVIKKSDGVVIPFSYKDEDLVNIINTLAAHREINILLPHGNDAIKSKVTIHMPEPLSVDDAWSVLITLLYAAGYTYFNYSSQLHEIVKLGASPLSNREPFPLYIGMDPRDLPDTESYIRYIYYAVNLRVSQEDATNEIVTVLGQLLPPGYTLQVDGATNAIIIISSSLAIKSAMKIITQLDKPAFQEKLEVMALTYASAVDVALLFNEKILQVNAARSRFDNRKTSDTYYFSPHIKIIADSRLNRLILRGRPEAINRVRNFIIEHIDIDLEGGNPVLHVYQLRYLSAEQCAAVLLRIVRGSADEGQRQSASQLNSGGTERYFGEVIIATDVVPQSAQQTDRPPEYAGGNKLVIAARIDDWKRIKKLLDDLDQPQRQVLLEVLVADLTLDDNRRLNSMIREPARIEFPANITAQASHNIGPGILPNACTDPTTIGLIESPVAASTDLLRRAFSTNTSTGDVTCSNDGSPGTGTSAVGFSPAGTAAVSISDSDGKTWGILEILKTFNNRKVISYPHIVATHNQKAYFERGETLRLRDAASVNAVSPEIKITDVPANLKLTITPRISGSNVVNLQIDVEINDFIGVSTARITRRVTTNANVDSSNVLAIGGLTRLDSTSGTTDTPFLSKVPILGNLVKSRRGDVIRTNLTVFICPTILEPRFHKGLNAHSHDYVDLANNAASRTLAFDGLRDPITRWFFGTEDPGIKKTQKFLEKENLDKLRSKNTPAAPLPVIPDISSEESLKDIVRSRPNPFNKTTNKRSPNQKAITA